MNYSTRVNTAIEYVCIAKAAYLLGICRQRVQQLASAGRIEGAVKEGRFWRIPLNQHNMPEVISADRGVEGTWRKRRQQATTYIHVNQNKIKENNNKEDKEPVICLKQGNRSTYCNRVTILDGLCQVIYDPYHPKDCGARVWLEIDPAIAAKLSVKSPFVTESFKVSFA